jgi:hypothetical protein
MCHRLPKVRVSSNQAFESGEEEKEWERKFQTALLKIYWYTFETPFKFVVHFTLIPPQ